MRDASQPLPDRPIERVPPGPLIAQGHAALRRAAESPAELTVALLCFHIAIEQLCRELLAQHPGCSPQEREQAWMESLSWGRMLATLQRHGLLSRELRATLMTLNDERNDLCHRQPSYPGWAEQVERYAAAADLLSARVQLGTWAYAIPDRSALDDANFAMLAHAQAASRPLVPSQPRRDDDFLAQMLAAPGAATAERAPPAVADQRSAPPRARQPGTPAAPRPTPAAHTSPRPAAVPQGLHLLVIGGLLGVVLLLIALLASLVLR